LKHRIGLEGTPQDQRKSKKMPPQGMPRGKREVLSRESGRKEGIKTPWEGIGLNRSKKKAARNKWRERTKEKSKDAKKIEPLT